MGRLTGSVGAVTTGDDVSDSTRWILWSRDGRQGPVDSPARPATSGLSGRPSGGAGSGPSPARSAAALGEAADGRARQLEPAGAGLRSAVADAATDAHDASSPTGRLINEIIAARAVEVEYQPVFDVDNKQVVGFEALTRGPDGPLRSPLHLFAAARLVGRLGELDWICRAVALRGLLEAELHPAISLFVNVEPDSLIEPCPEDLLETIWEAENRLRIMIDLTGRTLSRYPREVLETVRRARAARWGVALSHVEFSAAGLALLPTIEPDVIKLDHPLLATGQGHVSAAITGALSEAERTGAALVVQRVEDESAAV